MRWALAVSLLAAVHVSGCLAPVAGWLAEESSEPPLPTAPDFTLTSTGYENGTLGEPVEFSLSDYRGKTVVLDFMAVTCTSCRVLTQDVLKPLHQEYGDRSDFVILSIDTWADPGSGSAPFGGETRDDLIQLQREEDVPWRHALDTDDVYLKYSAVQLPKIAVVDPDGRILLERVGIPPLDEVRAAVEDAA